MPILCVQMNIPPAHRHVFVSLDLQGSLSNSRLYMARVALLPGQQDSIDAAAVVLMHISHKVCIYHQMKQRFVSWSNEVDDPQSQQDQEAVSGGHDALVVPVAGAVWQGNCLRIIQVMAVTAHSTA
jgi:hypothetical protein